MLIIVPPSESKRPAPESGPALDLAGLSFPELTSTRALLIEALVTTSARPDAFRRLGLRPSHAPEIARNTWLTELPTIPVLDLYTGPLHAGLDAARLSLPAKARLRDGLVVSSALWGLLRPSDHVPPYRLHVNARPIGIDRIDATWRAVLPDVLAAVAGDRLVVDLRSIYYQAMGLPKGLEDRTVALKIDQGPNHQVGDVIAKRVRGEAAHHLLESAVEPEDPEALADALADRWPVRLEEPERRGRPWTMTLTVDA
ncbi:MAG TPA: peroxide stress protein YaaA [Candidatus Limnocylindrales bacterium]|nr:peroxide stress protein YaaA [Candidatus Limnocylindrales bacterium]